MTGSRSPVEFYNNSLEWRRTSLLRLILMTGNPTFNVLHIKLLRIWIKRAVEDGGGDDDFLKVTGCSTVQHCQDVHFCKTLLCATFRLLTSCSTNICWLLYLFTNWILHHRLNIHIPESKWLRSFRCISRYVVEQRFLHAFDECLCRVLHCRFTLPSRKQGSHVRMLLGHFENQKLE